MSPKAPRLIFNGNATPRPARRKAGHRLRPSPRPGSATSSGRNAGQHRSPPRSRGRAVLRISGQGQPLPGRLACVRRQNPIQMILPWSDPRHRLMRPLIAEIRHIGPQNLPDCIPRDVQLAHDLLQRPALHIEGPPDSRNRTHPLQLPLRPLTRSERSDETSGGSKLGADTPAYGVKVARRNTTVFGPS